ncbi:hypothetical protein [Streptomyces sp. NPDC001880]
MTAGEPAEPGLPGLPARPLRNMPASKIVETLIEEAMKIAEGMGGAGTPSGVPTVTVS